MLKFSNKYGFTMIELMGVILVVAILGSLAVTQFLDQRHEARVAAMEQIRQSVKMGLSLQHKNTLLRCNNAASLKIPYDSFLANDVTSGASPLCSVDQIPNAADRKIYDSSGSFNYQNQMNGLTTVGFAPALGSGQSYIQSECSTSSSGNAYGWCYTEDGDFFAADDETRTIASSGEGASSEAASSSEASSSDSSTCGTELYYEWYNGESCSCRYQAWDTCLNMATGGGYVESDPSSCTSNVGVCPSALSSSSSSAGTLSYCSWDGSGQGVCTAYGENDPTGSPIYGGAGASYCCSCTDNNQVPPVTGIGDSCSWTGASSSSSSSECPMGQTATSCDGGATFICTSDPGSACVSSSSESSSSEAGGPYSPACDCGTNYGSWGESSVCYPDAMVNSTVNVHTWWDANCAPPSSSSEASSASSEAAATLTIDSISVTMGGGYNESLSGQCVPNSDLTVFGTVTGWITCSSGGTYSYTRMTSTPCVPSGSISISDNLGNSTSAPFTMYCE
jgi:prepilin-type N-terminal cleavage/methylation domain-containing protein